MPIITKSDFEAAEVLNRKFEDRTRALANIQAVRAGNAGPATVAGVVRTASFKEVVPLDDAESDVALAQLENITAARLAATVQQMVNNGVVNVGPGEWTVSV